MRNNRTGCTYLDAYNVEGNSSGVRITATNVEVADQKLINLCLNCPEEECMLRTNIEKPLPAKSDTIISKTIQCYHCFQMEDITFKKGKLQRHPRYIQKGNTIYHICGEAKIIGSG